MVADIRGGFLVGVKALSLGFVREAAHSRVEVAACLEVCVGGVAVIADAAHGVVQPAHEVVWPCDHRVGTRVGLELLTSNRATWMESIA